MNAVRSSGGRPHVRQGSVGGFLLMEVMVSLAVVIIIAGGTRCLRCGGGARPTTSTG